MDFYDPRFPHGTSAGYRHGCIDEAECPNFNTRKPTCPEAKALADQTPPPAEQSPATTADSDVAADALPADVDEPRPEEAPIVPPAPAEPTSEIDGEPEPPSRSEPEVDDAAPAEQHPLDVPLPQDTPPGTDVDPTVALPGWTDRQIRAWCKAVGVDPGQRGPLRIDARAAYLAALPTNPETTGADADEETTMNDRPSTNPLAPASAAAAPIPAERIVRCRACGEALATPSDGTLQHHDDDSHTFVPAALADAVRLELHPADPEPDVDQAAALAEAQAAVADARATLEAMEAKYKHLAADYAELETGYSSLAAMLERLGAIVPPGPDQPTYLALQLILDPTESTIRVPITLGIGRLELALDVATQTEDSTRDLTLTVKGVEP